MVVQLLDIRLRFTTSHDRKYSTCGSVIRTTRSKLVVYYIIDTDENYRGVVRR